MQDNSRTVDFITQVCSGRVFSLLTRYGNLCEMSQKLFFDL